MLKKANYILIIMCMVALSNAQDLIEVDSTPVPDSPFVSVAKSASLSVVSIRITRDLQDNIDTGSLEEMYDNFFPEKEGKTPMFKGGGTGTGFVVTSEGHILTNNHVIEGADEVFVRFGGDPLDYSAEVVGTDHSSDLAVLKVECKIDPLVFAVSEKVNVGDWAIAIGNPFGNLAGSMTVGVVSAKGRANLDIKGGAPRYQDFLQIDASINPGNSGGPLLDINGRIIGVNTAVSGGQGIGFAIPSDFARTVLSKIIEHGYVPRGWIGVQVQEGLDDNGKVQVRLSQVLSGSPAFTAGLQVGDIIKSIDGTDVESEQQLQFIVAGFMVDDEVSIEVVRNGGLLKTNLKPVEQPISAKKKDNWLGMVLVEFGDKQALKYMDILPDGYTEGLIIIEVEPGSVADKAELSEGDILLMVGGNPVIDKKSLLKTKQLLSGVKHPVKLLVESGSEQRYVEVEIQEENKKDL